MNNMKYSILGVRNVHNKTNQDQNKVIPSKTYFGVSVYETDVITVIISFYFSTRSSHVWVGSLSKDFLSLIY